MKKLTRFAAVLGAFSGLLLGSVNAAASPVFRQNFRITATEVGTDVCAGGQPVAVTETLHFVLLVNADNAGGFHVNSAVNIENGRGTNLVTGERYVATGANATAFEAKPPFPFVSTIEATSVLVSTGSTSNLYTKILIHETVNAKGSVTAEIFDFEVFCRG
jgi:hypothetical protein